MELLTNAQRQQLLTNGRTQREAIRSGADDTRPLARIAHPVMPCRDRRATGGSAHA